MKKIVLAAVMLLSSVSMFAQHEVSMFLMSQRQMVTQDLVWQLVQKLNIN